MNKTHIRAYTKALVESVTLRSSALEIELAVGLAVLFESEPSRRLARETLLTIYHGAGYQCDKPGAVEWRAVNRRITASVALYDTHMKSDVAALAETVRLNDLVEALRPMIAALKVKSINEVLLACDKVRPARKVSHPVEGHHIEAGALYLTIPTDATREDMLALATKLMELAMSKFEQPVAAEPESVEALSGEPA